MPGNGTEKEHTALPSDSGIVKESIEPAGGAQNTRLGMLMRVLDAALNSVDPERGVTKNLNLRNGVLRIKGEEFRLNNYRKVHVIGAGKSAPFLYNGLNGVEGVEEYISGGIVVSLAVHAFEDERVRFVAGSHPVPDNKSLNAGKAVLDYVERYVEEDDLVLFLLTGGASALMVAPYPPLELEDKIEVTRLLLRSGADIREINCVRKHMSALKGGRLAEKIAPAQVVSLIISDIVGSPLEDIGSGPTIGDSTTFLQAAQILEKYGLSKRVSDAVREFFQRGMDGQIPETPPPDSPEFSQNRHFILGDNPLALKSAKSAAEKSGLPARITVSGDGGDAREAARNYARIIRSAAGQKEPGSPLLLLAGGELTVNVTGSGKGGRNQEFVLALLLELRDFHRPFTILSVGTDGIDGPTDAAGAWINEKTPSRAGKLGLNPEKYLENNDSYRFFRELGQLIITGPTHTNVMDLRMFLLV